MPRILLIDDDPEFSSLLTEALQSHGHQVHYLTEAEEGLQLLCQQTPPAYDVILLDQYMAPMTGTEFLVELRLREIRLPVLLFTEWDASDVAILASKLGAFRYLPKPNSYSVTKLAPLLREITLAANSSKPISPRSEDVLPGTSESMRAVHHQIGEAANHDRPVLIVGEVGTGKEQVALLVHRFSPRADRPLLHAG